MHTTMPGACHAHPILSPAPLSQTEPFGNLLSCQPLLGHKAVSTIWTNLACISFERMQPVAKSQRKAAMHTQVARLDVMEVTGAAELDADLKIMARSSCSQYTQTLPASSKMPQPNVVSSQQRREPCPPQTSPQLSLAWTPSPHSLPEIQMIRACQICVHDQSAQECKPSSDTLTAVKADIMVQVRHVDTAAE